MYALGLQEIINIACTRCTAENETQQLQAGAIFSARVVLYIFLFIIYLL